MWDEVWVLRTGVNTHIYGVSVMEHADLVTILYLPKSVKVLNKPNKNPLNNSVWWGLVMVLLLSYFRSLSTYL